MKILLVSMLFMVIMSGLLALQIKASYAYRIAHMLYISQKHNFLLESVLTLAIKHIKQSEAKSYTLQDSIRLEEYTGTFSLEMHNDAGTIYSKLNDQAGIVKTEYYTCAKSIKDGRICLAISLEV